MNPSQVIAWLRALAWLFIVGLTMWVLSRVYRTITLFFVSAAISYLLYPWVRWLHERSLALLGGRKMSWTWAVVLAYLTLPTVVGVLGFATLPAVTSQMDALRRNLPDQVDRTQKAVVYWQGRLDRMHLPPTVQQQVNTLVSNAVNRIGEGLADFFGQIGNLLLSAFALFLYLVLALIISQFMLLYLPEVSARFFEAVPRSYQEEVKGLLFEIHFMLGGFLKGTFLLSLAAGLGTFVALSVLSMVSPLLPGFLPFQYSLIVGLLTMLAYPIPLLGQAALALVVFVMAWSQNGSWLYVGSITALVLIVFNSVDRVVGPRVMSKAVGVSPLFVMFSAFAGAEFFGFWGMLLGVPAAAALKILFRFIHSRILVPQDAESMAALVEAAEAISAVSGRVAESREEGDSAGDGALLEEGRPGEGKVGPVEDGKQLASLEAPVPARGA